MSQLHVDTRPRVLSCMPGRGGCSAEPRAVMSHDLLATRGKVVVMPSLFYSSLLCLNFNSLWAAALVFRRNGVADYFCLHHDDVEVRTHGWLDEMVTEANRVGAAVLSAVIPIKDDSGTTSTALDTGDPWRPTKLTLAECRKLPATFGQADVAAAGYGGRLLLNTGLMLIDLRRPYWYETVRRDGDEDELFFRFQIRDRIRPMPDGQLRAQVRSEDWEFSRLCHERGVPIYATTKIQCVHHGDYEWPNFPPAEAPAEQTVEVAAPEEAAAA